MRDIVALAIMRLSMRSIPFALPLIALLTASASFAAGPPADIISQPLTPEESLKAIVVRPGLTVELVAAEPLVVDPVAIAWGIDGKLWVVEMNDYPLGLDGKGKPGGRVKFLTDDDGDGRYDRATIFLDGLQYPTAVLPWRRGVLVCSVPEIIFAADTDGDGRADRREPLFVGLHVGNPQHLANGLRYGLDDWVHCANGATNTSVKSVTTGQTLNVGTRDFRIRPDTGEIEALAGRSQCLRECDDWGNWFGNSNSNPMYHFVLEEQYLRRNPHAIYPSPQRDVSEQPGASQVFPISRTVSRFNDLNKSNRFTSACSAMIYRDELLGVEFYGNSFVCEPVHNLVHREVVRADGVSFRSRRADDEQESEFLASSDNWFRPAMVRTGPDGALWIADMYRMVIEHPEWIPKDWQSKLDLRAGSDKGRIYRVFPTALKPWPIPRLDTLTLPELAAKLESSNGTVRDMVMQHIVERVAGSERNLEIGKAAEVLIRSASDAPRPQTRLHALCTLAAIDDLDNLVLEKAFADEHAAVRRWALRFVTAERFAGSQEFRSRATPLSNDPDPTVRMQLALTMGEVNMPVSWPVLAKYFRQTMPETIPNAAAVSSLHGRNVPLVIERVVNQSIVEDTTDAAVATLIDTAAGSGNRIAMAHVVRATVSGRDDQKRLAAVAGLLDGLARHRQSPAKLGDGAEPELAANLEKLAAIIAAARETASDQSASLDVRLQSLALLGREPQHRAAELEILGGLLTPKSLDVLQAAVISALARFDSPEAAGLLLANFKQLTPLRKAQVLDACLGRAAWAELLLDAVAAKQVSAAEIDIARAQQLLNHSHKPVRLKAAEVLAASISPDRKRVVEEYQSAVTMVGDAARGREVFAKSCANCHRIGDLGNNVGPELITLSDKSPTTMLVSILDPNRAVESKYVAYVAETDAGLTFTGVLIGETSTAVTLALADGKRQTILRTELESFASTAKSFMPEGMEKDLPPQKLADVMAFVGATNPARKVFSGNTPTVVRPEALRGEFYLLAEQAEIYGDTLVYESKFANLGYWKSANDRAVWDVEIVRAGLYDVSLEYACPADCGGTLVIEGAGNRATAIVKPTGGWETYGTLPIGQFQLAAGRQRLVVRSEGLPHGALFDLKSVRLKPR